MEIVPSNQRRDLPYLIALGLPTAVVLQIHEFGDAGSGEDPMAAPAADLAEPESFQEPHQISKIYVADIAPRAADGIRDHRQSQLALVTRYTS